MDEGHGGERGHCSSLQVKLYAEEAMCDQAGEGAGNYSMAFP